MFCRYCGFKVTFLKKSSIIEKDLIPTIMKKKRITLTLIALVFCAAAAMAQTKKTTSTKKKSAPKEINVFICTAVADKLYHKRRTCAGLNKCNNELKHISTAAELKKWKRKSCPRCYSM
jgi:hypothetical protein